jgi:hypothetical protein
VVATLLHACRPPSKLPGSGVWKGFVACCVPHALPACVARLVR